MSFEDRLAKVESMLDTLRCKDHRRNLDTLDAAAFLVVQLVRHLDGERTLDIASMQKYVRTAMDRYASERIPRANAMGSLLRQLDEAMVERKAVYQLLPGDTSR